MLHDTHNKEQDTDEPEILPCKAISLMVCHNDSVVLIREYRTNTSSFIGILCFFSFLVKLFYAVNEN